MQDETLLPTVWRARPRGFVALMSLYESNYLRLVRLCGDPKQLRGERVSRISGGCDLRLVVLENAAYTTTLNLTHVFSKALPWHADATPLVTYPDVRVRAYCDARLVQAQHWPEGEQPNRSNNPRQMERELHQRWAYNIMLNKWLEYCLDLGHQLR
jgi:uncharacterized protein YqiB (DUF1249 family)